MTIERKLLAVAHPDLAASAADPAVMDERSGRFTGWASTFGNKDLVDDVVVYGAFEGIPDGAEFPLLDHHKTDGPIGLIRVSQKSEGLFAQGSPNMEVTRARELRSLMKQGAVTGLSIGYTVKDSYRKGGVRYLTKLELAEVSVCTFPANPQARITGVKALLEARMEKERTARELASLMQDIRAYTAKMNRDLEQRAMERRRAA